MTHQPVPKVGLIVIEIRQAIFADLEALSKLLDDYRRFYGRTPDTLALERSCRLASSMANPSSSWLTTAPRQSVSRSSIRASRRSRWPASSSSTTCL